MKEVPFFWNLYGDGMSDLFEPSVWNVDGHRVLLQLNRNELSIQMVVCPGHKERSCRLGGLDCIVTWFLEVYGLDCNVGVAEVASDLELAWSVQGDPSNVELCQVWVIPVTDEAFASWLEMQQSTVTSFE
jgi:hypothetical protein